MCGTQFTHRVLIGHLYNLLSQLSSFRFRHRQPSCDRPLGIYQQVSCLGYSSSHRLESKQHDSSFPIARPQWGWTFLALFFGRWKTAPKLSVQKTLHFIEPLPLEHAQRAQMYKNMTVTQKIPAFRWGANWQACQFPPRRRTRSSGWACAPAINYPIIYMKCCSNKVGFKKILTRTHPTKGGSASRGIRTKLTGRERILFLERREKRHHQNWVKLQRKSNRGKHSTNYRVNIYLSFNKGEGFIF